MQNLCLSKKMNSFIIKANYIDILNKKIYSAYIYISIKINTDRE